MEYYFNIAQIGIRINGFRAMKIIESNLIPFITSLEIYESLQEKVTILVKEVSDFEIEEMVHADTENNRNYASFGHKKYAVFFSANDWKQDQITIYLNEDCYKEASWNINQFFSVIGLHSLFLHRNGMILHASYIAHDNGAILFTAPSQTGKSTQANLWKQHVGAEIINEDRVLICKKDMTWYACGIPMCGSSDTCVNAGYPLKAVIELKQRKENKIVQLMQLEKYKALLLGTQYHLKDRNEETLVCKLISNLIETMEIVRYSCCPEMSAVETLKKYLEKEEKNEC